MIVDEYHPHYPIASSYEAPSVRKQPSRSQRKAKQRKTLFERQKGRCWYCGIHLALDTKQNDSNHLNPNTATLDHIKPKSQGGGNHLGNFVVSCYYCNSQKGASMKFFPKEFIWEKEENNSTHYGYILGEVIQVYEDECGEWWWEIENRGDAQGPFESVECAKSEATDYLRKANWS